MVHESGWPSAKPKTLLLRLKPALHRALVRWARDEMRSVHAQVEPADQPLDRDVIHARRPHPPADLLVGPARGHQLRLVRRVDPVEARADHLRTEVIEVNLLRPEVEEPLRDLPRRGAPDVRIV